MFSVDAVRDPSPAHTHGTLASKKSPRWFDLDIPGLKM